MISDSIVMLWTAGIPPWVLTCTGGLRPFDSQSIIIGGPFPCFQHLIRSLRWNDQRVFGRFSDKQCKYRFIVMDVTSLRRFGSSVSWFWRCSQNPTSLFARLLYCSGWFCSISLSLSLSLPKVCRPNLFLKCAVSCFVFKVCCILLFFKCVLFPVFFKKECAEFPG